MKETQKKIHLGIQVTPELRRRIRIKAAELGCSNSALVVSLVEKHLKSIQDIAELSSDPE